MSSTRSGSWVLFSQIMYVKPINTYCKETKHLWRLLVPLYWQYMTMKANHIRWLQLLLTMLPLISLKLKKIFRLHHSLLFLTKTYMYCHTLTKYAWVKSAWVPVCRIKILILMCVILPAVLLISGMVYDNVHPGSLQQLLFRCPFAWHCHGL